MAFPLIGLKLHDMVMFSMDSSIPIVEEALGTNQSASTAIP